MKNFIVKEHQANFSIGHLTVDDLLSFLNQSISAIKQMATFDTEMEEIAEGIDSANSLEACLTDDQIDEMLELIEDSIIRDYDAIRLFYNHCYSTWESLNSYIRTTLFTIEEFNNVAKKVVDGWTCPTLKEFKTLRNYAVSILTNLIFIVYFEFDMDSVNQEESDGRFYIDEIYDKYCKQYDFNPEKYSHHLSELKSIYKIKLNFFDEYPELEEPFESIMGPNLANIDESLLTIDLVKQVLSGEISDTQLYEIIKCDGVGDGAVDGNAVDLGNGVGDADNGLAGMNLF